MTICVVFGGFKYFFGVFCAFFLTIFAIWTEANEERKAAEHKQTETERRWVGAGVERGSAAGAQVSAATRITYASTDGTGVCITSSPRHDGSDGTCQW